MALIKGSKAIKAAKVEKRETGVRTIDDLGEAGKGVKLGRGNGRYE